MKRVRIGSIVAAVALSTVAATVTPAAAVGRDGGAPLKSYAVTVKGGKTQEVNASGWGKVTFFSFNNPAITADSQYGRFTGQIHYGESATKTFAWGFKLHPGTAGAATGPMSETAVLYLNGKPTGYKDTHPAIPANYLVHSSAKVALNKVYKLVINETFPIAGRGTRHITTEFEFIVHTM
ncbi:hypothetical protein AB0O47_07245 [Streptomyces noursei]|uniref:hypothetical protein n=1 Tax=Streptomyces noursei TaxID=1971 RepID=UPI00344E9288